MMRKMGCKVCGGSDFLIHERIAAYCIDCGIEYARDDALALEQDWKKLDGPSPFDEG